MYNHMIGIYKFENEKGEIYVGCSTNIENRKQHHLLVHNITSFEVLEECTKIELLQREKYWISHYNSYNNGLNKNKGGSGNIAHTEATKLKISKARKGWIPSPERGGKIGNKLKGRSYSEDHKKAISEGNKGVSRGKGRTSPNKGNKYSNEVKNKISNSRKGIIFSNEQKSLMSKNQWKKRQISQYSIDGVFIRDWDSISEAKLSLGGGDIAACVRGEQKTSKGFIWKYKM